MAAAGQTFGDQERDLWLASRRYVSGEITVEELEAIEIGYTQNFDKAMMALAERSVRKSILERMNPVRFLYPAFRYILTKLTSRFRINENL
jgi:hypothetical protein